MRPNHIDMQHNNINVLHVDRKLYVNIVNIIML